MKKLMLVLAAVAVTMGLVSSKLISTEKEASPDQPAVDYKKEEAAILKVINDESAAFWNKDFDAFADCWAHGPYVRTMGWWAAGGVTVVQGWEERAARTRAHMEASPEANPTANNVIRKNMNLRIFKDVAWLTFDQYGEDTGDETMDMPGLSRETRILEKQDGKWKIAYVGWLLEGTDNSD